MKRAIFKVMTVALVALVGLGVATKEVEATTFLCDISACNPELVTVSIGGWGTSQKPAGYYVLEITCRNKYWTWSTVSKTGAIWHPGGTSITYASKRCYSGTPYFVWGTQYVEKL